MGIWKYRKMQVLNDRKVRFIHLRFSIIHAKINVVLPKSIHFILVPLMTISAFKMVLVGIMQDYFVKLFRCALLFLLIRPKELP